MNCLARQLVRALDELYEARQGYSDTPLMYNMILSNYRNIYVSHRVEEINARDIDEYCEHQTKDVDPKICDYCQQLLDKD